MPLDVRPPPDRQETIAEKMHFAAPDWGTFTAAELSSALLPNLRDNPRKELEILRKIDPENRQDSFNLDRLLTFDVYRSGSGSTITSGPLTEAILAFKLWRQDTESIKRFLFPDQARVSAQQPLVEAEWNHFKIGTSTLRIVDFLGLDDPKVLAFVAREAEVSSGIEVRTIADRIIKSQNGNFCKNLDAVTFFMPPEIQVGHHLDPRRLIKGSSSSKEQLTFQEAFISTVAFFNSYLEILEKHDQSIGKLEQFSELSAIRLQAKFLLDILQNSSCSQSSTKTNSTVYQLSHELQRQFPELPEKTEIATNDIALSKAIFLSTLRVDRLVHTHVALATIFALIEKAALQTHYGSFVDVLAPAKSGLVFAFNDIVYPYIANGSPLAPEVAQMILTRKRLAASLFNSKTVIKNVSESSMRRDELPTLRWAAGVTLEKLNVEIAKIRLPQEVQRALRSDYLEHACIPLNQESFGESKRIHIIFGANSSGKSLRMKAIAQAIGSAMKAERSFVSQGQMSVCDGVFHDFFVAENTVEAASKFRAQMRCVIDFLRNGTEQSIAFFDELFHGTSSPYQVSLAFAILEEFDSLNRRVYVSTHEPLLRFVGDPQAESHLRGKLSHYSDKSIIRTVWSGAVQASSMGTNYQSEPVISIDSDSFRIAREEGLPDKIIRRAERLFGLLLRK